MLQVIHGHVDRLYKTEARLSYVMDSMIQDLEDAKVDSMT